jgi:hypothetical protein
VDDRRRVIINEMGFTITEQPAGIQRLFTCLLPRGEASQSLGRPAARPTLTNCVKSRVIAEWESVKALGCSAKKTIYLSGHPLLRP